MILSQYNALKFYIGNTKRIYEYSHNNYDFICNFLSGYIPSIQLIAETGSGDATLYVMSECDEVMFSKQMTTTSVPTGLQLGHTKLISLASQENDINLLVGNFYLRVSYNGEEYDSDMFKYVASTDDLLEFYATSSDIEIGGYQNNLENFIYKAYFRYESKDIVTETEEEAEEKEGFKYLMYGATVFKRSIVIYGNESIFRFLSGLRMLSCNGSVRISYDGETFNAKDIVVEKDGEFGYSIPIRIDFKDLSESIIVLNAS